jgi:hypothetical protein
MQSQVYSVTWLAPYDAIPTNHNSFDSIGVGTSVKSLHAAFLFHSRQLRMYALESYEPVSLKVRMVFIPQQGAMRSERDICRSALRREYSASLLGSWNDPF